MPIVQKQVSDIKKISSFNVNLSCVIDERHNRLACERCEKFFDCGEERKWEIYRYGRLALAKQKMAAIKHKVAIVGGKGGVGKSMLTVNLAAALAKRGNSVCVLDFDFDGSSVPKMLGIVGQTLRLGRNGIEPAVGAGGVKAVSAGLLADKDMVTWFTDTRRAATEEFITHVDFGVLDYLVVDLPPGTSAETVNTMLFIPDLSGVVLITVPSEVSQGVALRAATVCGKGKVPALGVVENMSGHICPHCGHHSNPYSAGGGAKLAEILGVPLIGQIPIEGVVAKACDEGVPFVLAYPESRAAREMERIADAVAEGAVKNRRSLDHLTSSFARRSWW